MSAHGGAEPPPARRDVQAKLRDLLSGNVSREDVADWAAQWVRMANPNVKDLYVWKALTRISGADMISTDRPYLYGEQDFEAWLKELDE